MIIGAAYAMVQQATRLSADDDPLALAQTIKQELVGGSSPNDVINSQLIDLSVNNNPFVIITDSSKHVLASTATLNGQTPLPPQGVFDYTAQHGSDHFTWQPAENVRLATRVSTYQHESDKGYIITGQSLKPYEDRINTYTALAVAAWLAVLAWNFLFLILPELKFKSR